jgi:hypothetical protein
MKYLKTYEKHQVKTEYDSIKPQIGDYVICQEIFSRGLDEKHIINFLKSNIGQYVKKQNTNNSYIVKYNKIPPELKIRFIKGLRAFNESEIIHFSPNKEDLELILKTNKYNL